MTRTNQQDTTVYPRKPGLIWRAILRFVKTTDKVYPWYRWPLRLGVIILALRRGALQRFNLIPVGRKQLTQAGLSEKERKQLRQENEGVRVLYREDDGGGNDVIHGEEVGRSGCPFGRNMIGVRIGEREVGRGPGVDIVAKRLLRRREGGFKGAGLQFNLMAASWIQAMIHDWMNHEKDLERGVEVMGQDGRFRFKGTKFGVEGESRNLRTAWWDASFLYGQNEEEVRRGRLGVLGKLKSGKGNRLPVDERGLYLVGDQENSWVGVALLQELFVKEHNEVCDVLAKAHPNMSDDDLFRKARLVVAAVVAKIHTMYVYSAFFYKVLRLSIMLDLTLTNSRPYIPSFFSIYLLQ